MVAGVRVLAVFADSPADGTLQQGDLITAVDGHPVHNTWALVLAVRQHPAGTTLTIEFVRDGHRFERPILLAPAPTS
jgi:S1-C subfamily serine protease